MGAQLRPRTGIQLADEANDDRPTVRLRLEGEGYVVLHGLTSRVVATADGVNANCKQVPLPRRRAANRVTRREGKEGRQSRQMSTGAPQGTPSKEHSQAILPISWKSVKGSKER